MVSLYCQPCPSTSAPTVSPTPPTTLQPCTLLFLPGTWADSVMGICPREAQTLPPPLLAPLVSPGGFTVKTDQLVPGLHCPLLLPVCDTCRLSKLLFSSDSGSVLDQPRHYAAAFRDGLDTVKGMRASWSPPQALGAESRFLPRAGCLKFPPSLIFRGHLGIRCFLLHPGKASVGHASSCSEAAGRTYKHICPFCSSSHGGGVGKPGPIQRGSHAFVLWRKPPFVTYSRGESTSMDSRGTLSGF